MLKLHCRYTPYDISGHSFDWLIDKSTRLLIGKETKTKQGEDTEPHYHIYAEIEGVIDDTVRNNLQKSLCIPKGGRGKNNKYYAIDWDWKDPSYVCKYDDVVVTKGFTEPQLLELVVLGKARYLQKEKKEETVVWVQPPKKVSINKDKEIMKELYEWYMVQKHADTEMMGPTKKEMIDRCCWLTRKYDKGINPYKIRDLVLAVMYDTGDYAQEVVNKISNMMV